MLKKICGLLAVMIVPVMAGANEYRTVERPRQECWNEQVPVQAVGSGVGGALIGGIAGGILGNQVGGGNGKTIATAVGAMTGAVVGDRMSSAAPGYRTVQRCRTVVDYEQVPVYREPVQIIQQPMQVVSPPVVVGTPVYGAPTYGAPVYYVAPEGYYYPRRYWRHHRHGRDDD